MKLIFFKNIFELWLVAVIFLLLFEYKSAYECRGLFGIISDASSILAISILLKLEPYSDGVGESEKAYGCESVTADR